MCSTIDYRPSSRIDVFEEFKSKNYPFYQILTKWLFPVSKLEKKFEKEDIFKWCWDNHLQSGIISVGKNICIFSERLEDNNLRNDEPSCVKLSSEFVQNYARFRIEGNFFLGLSEKPSTPPDLIIVSKNNLLMQGMVSKVLSTLF